MGDIDLRSEQEPLKAEYEADPSAAQITLTAPGEEQDDVRACSVDIGRAIYEAELHEGAGGPGAGACSGDLLLGALAACAQLTAQAVAENFGVDADVTVEASGDLDEDTSAALREVTEQYCVVFQTLADLPEIESTWTVR